MALNRASGVRGGGGRVALRRSVAPGVGCAAQGSGADAASDGGVLVRSSPRRPSTGHGDFVRRVPRCAANGVRSRGRRAGFTVVELFAAGVVLSVVLLALLPVVTWTVRQINGLNDRFEILLAAENAATVLEAVSVGQLRDAAAVESLLSKADIPLRTDHWHCELSHAAVSAGDAASNSDERPAGVRSVRIILRFHFDDLRPAPPPMVFEVVRFVGGG
ncbi:MAG: hypothetical protein D6725_18075 [Planctomycetota bacterium]|nr:MAG: hypothetical protein D6725_18075 [Planctomycetota bacterium]